MNFNATPFVWCLLGTAVGGRSARRWDPICVWLADDRTDWAVSLQFLQERRHAQRCGHDLLDKLCQDRVWWKHRAHPHMITRASRLWAQLLQCLYEFGQHYLIGYSRLMFTTNAEMHSHGLSVKSETLGWTKWTPRSSYLLPPLFLSCLSAYVCNCFSKSVMGRQWLFLCTAQWARGDRNSTNDLHI